jgi:hypothetical protein
MKWLFKWALRLVLLLVALAVVALLSKDAVVKAALEHQIRARTGLDARIGRLSVGLFTPVIDVEQLKVYNPAEFGGVLLLDAPELHIEYDRASLSSGRAHLKLVRLKISELNVVRNAAGQTNLLRLDWKNPVRTFRTLRQMPFPAIDVLNLSVGRVRLMDLEHPKRNREFQPGLDNQIFRNVRSMDDFRGILFLLWLRSGGFVGVPQPDQIFTLNCSPGLSESANAASRRGICSRSLRLTTSTGECM